MRGDAGRSAQAIAGESAALLGRDRRDGYRRHLTYRDRWAVELAARLMHKAVSNGASTAELSTLRSLLAAMGMTPADRSKLSVPVEKPKNNPWAEFAAKTRELNARPKPDPPE
jgi:hypothetical protein